ncbi:uncharacterized protein LOC113790193 [Dermatophagoides pteronyssinus]|uniref:uncharacterized protein LOC113790193 n=1 Tax=Dermatophagoides pteronyssinus TaxID=6956 RepID=UPI003F66E847
MKQTISVIVLLLIGTTLALKKSPDCDIERPIRECLKDGLLRYSSGQKINQFPDTIQDLNRACEELKKSETCARTFIDTCTESSYEKRSLDSLLDGIQRVMKRLCRSQTKKEKLLENVGCANSVVQDTKQCLKNYRMLVFAANKLDDKNKIMRILCCKSRKVAPCIGEAMKSKGTAVCSAKNIDYFKDVHQNIKQEMTAVVCSDFERDQCENVDVPNISESEYKDQNIFNPLRDLYKKVILG